TPNGAFESKSSYTQLDSEAGTIVSNRRVTAPTLNTRARFEHALRKN
ncbi:MAG: hypothetical protein ACI9X4_002856, partial [Glaciecola sp.]